MVQGQLRLTPALNWNGTAEITVTVSDGFLSDSETFTLTVIAVNNLPWPLTSTPMGCLHLFPDY